MKKKVKIALIIAWFKKLQHGMFLMLLSWFQAKDFFTHLQF